VEDEKDYLEIRSCFHKDVSFDEALLFYFYRQGAEALREEYLTDEQRMMNKEICTSLRGA
jgi:hypothetical protein